MKHTIVCYADRWIYMYVSCAATMEHVCLVYFSLIDNTIPFRWHFHICHFLPLFSVFASYDFLINLIQWKQTYIFVFLHISSIDAYHLFFCITSHPKLKLQKWKEPFLFPQFWKGVQFTYDLKPSRTNIPSYMSNSNRKWKEKITLHSHSFTSQEWTFRMRTERIKGIVGWKSWKYIRKIT